MFTLTKDCKISVVSAAAAAGVTAINSSRVDMTGFDSVCFLVSVNVSLDTAVITATALSNAADSTSNSTTEKAGTAVTDASANQTGRMFVVDVHKPQNRYAYCNVTRTVANVSINGIYAIQYNAAKGPLPVTQPTTLTVDLGGPNA